MDRVLHNVRIRQYVLSPSFELRGLLACRKEVLDRLAKAFVRAIFRRLVKSARSAGFARPQCGAIIAIQRFTKTLVVSPHLHVLVLDGAFVDDGEERRFVDAPSPTELDLSAIVRDVHEKMTRFLEQRGYLQDSFDGDLTAADRWFLRGLAEPSMLTPTRVPRSGIEYGGFILLRLLAPGCPAVLAGQHPRRRHRGPR